MKATPTAVIEAGDTLVLIVAAGTPGPEANSLVDSVLERFPHIDCVAIAADQALVIKASHQNQNQETP